MPNKPKMIWTICPICKRPTVKPASDFRKGHYSCSRKCAAKINPFRPSRYGSENSAWKGGRTIHGRGYVYLYAPDHPKASNGYVFEHILVAEKKLGRHLKPGETTHHINGDRGDNRPENIHVFESAGAHTAYHCQFLKRDNKGRFTGTTQKKEVYCGSFREKQTVFK